MRRWRESGGRERLPNAGDTATLEVVGEKTVSTSSVRQSPGERAVVWKTAIQNRRRTTPQSQISGDSDIARCPSPRCELA